MNWYKKQPKAVKVLSWIVGIPVALYLFPVTIGAGLIYLIIKKLKPTKLRTASVVVMTALTLVTGSAWVVALNSDLPAVTPKPEQKEEQTVDPNQPVDVVKVVDGDTVDVSIAGKTERLRLIGIDTPETVDPRVPVQCFGVEASNKAKELLEGKKVKLEADPVQGERDKYDRLLRYVYLPDGQSFNKLMISEGYAYEYTYQTPYKYQAEYKQAQKDAEANKRGLWADKVCDSEGAGSKYQELKDEGRLEGGSTSAQPSQSTNPVVVPVVPPKSSPAPNPATHQDKDCKDFATHAEAQAYFDANGGSKTNNFDRLDGNDRDGIVCESLP